ncbi:hypothetical protein Y032_0472g2075 [Ancylostoma ceylanicum]|uniref:Uncharacterized protein n=1 Tax=Ancylostoma ceylanicum TaxID=53326 RepID=A0A016WYN5_9BILA|nr:hypothetical protein Y032_0472g2075 [Ancylostoma ceylanicum]
MLKENMLNLNLHFISFHIAGVAQLSATTFLKRCCIILFKREAEPLRHFYNVLGDEATSAIRDGLELLLHGQQKIDSRLDCIQKEQVKSKQELEGDLMNIVDELKGDIAGKSFEQSVELEKVKVNVSDL